MNVSMMDEHERRELVSARGSTMVESVVKAAAACNKLFTQNCNLCTIYCDKQVQYEWVQEQYKMSTPINHLFSKLDNSLEVQLYRDFLFDEESVVEQVSSRSDE